ncbi:MAG TPA: TonB-dependent receptor [Steroidobacteraceae bacterium]|nr:TonB-dependent receptor [Steroidobacteraceae bacterium]
MPFFLLLADQIAQPLIAVEAAPVVVTGSRVAARPIDLGANVTVLERESFDIEKPAKLADALQRVAGIHVDSVGGRGGTGSLYLRGADPNYTLVLVDGVRVNDPTNARGGSFDFSTFDMADVQRIEIARGPYSAIYGGDALAGVINIITRRAPLAETHASLDAMAGGHDTREISLNAAGPLANGTWSLGAGDSNEGERIRGNDFNSQRFSAGYNTDFDASTRVNLTARFTQSERAGFPDDSGGFEFSAIRDPETRDADETVLGIGVEHDAGNAGFSLSLGYFDRDDHIGSPGVAPGVRDPFGVPPSVVDSSIERLTATFTGTQRLSDMFSLAYGAEFQREQGSSDGELDFGGGFTLPTSFDLTRTSWAPYAEARLSTPFGLSAQIGVRVDKPEDMGSVTSPRLRVAYNLGGDDTGIRLAGSWGRAFKLPSLYALGHPLVGNPDLSPERGESHEIELSQSLHEGKVFWSATWFDGEFRNAIDFDSGPPPMLVNRNRVDTRGLELAGRYAMNDAWSLDGSITHARSRIASSGDELRNRPDWRGGVGVHWAPTSVLKFSASATYVGESFDSSIATGDVDLGSYTRVDVSAVWQVSEKFETYLAIDNLTDEKYQQFVGFESRGVLPRAGVKFSL